jgi:hypothetical protein
MLPREFAARVKAYEERERVRWERQLLVVNTIRGAIAEDADPLTYEDLLEDEYEPPTAAEWEIDRQRVLERDTQKNGDD